jgi:hypothetical protein
VRYAGERSRAAARLSLAAGLALVAAGCSTPGPQAPPVTPTPTPTVEAPASPSALAPVDKVMVIAEENKTFDQVLGSGDAPYLTGLAAAYGSALHMDAGYPASCPSLAAYVILTSGGDQGICDDAPPADHPLAADNVFAQVQRSGREWRAYAESMPGTCALENAAGGLYLVRHAPATYYVAQRSRCRQWQVPAGTPAAGPLHDVVVAGRLPAYAFVTPNACNDMHGAVQCRNGEVATGDAWLSHWLPEVLAGPDFRSGRLAVVVTWDEGSSADNHIATVVLSRRTSHVRATQRWNHCSTLRTVEEILRLPLLGCAADASSMRAAFGL